LVLAALPSCAESSAAGALHGTWTVVSGSFLGQAAPAGQIGMELTFTPEKLVWHFETSEGPKSFDGIYRCDPSKRPMELDLAEPGVVAPETFSQAIYEVEGDTLTISMGLERPRSLDDEAMTRLVLKRR
jgi:uncharacterized protein (TIGR03067 family)